LPGYENSAPVRIGNDASKQLQLDIFGEVADAMFQALKAGMAPSASRANRQCVYIPHSAAAGLWRFRIWLRCFR
jgi:GH15 family glucan-1,4-alpha-glucosidase